MDARLVREVLAVAEGPLPFPKLAAAVGGLGALAPTVAELARGTGWLTDRSRAWLADDVAEPIVRGLIRDGRYLRIASELARVDPFDLRPWGYYGEHWPIVREARRAMVAGNVERWNQVTQVRPVSLAQFVANPLDPELLRGLHPTFQGWALFELIEGGFLYARATPGATDLALSLAPGSPSRALVEAAARSAVLAGRFEEAASLAASAELRGVQGLLALLRGDVKASVAAYAKELAWAREVTHRKNVLLQGPDGALVPLAYLLEGGAQRKKQALALIDFAGKELRNEDRAVPYDGWPALARWADPQRAEGPVPDHPFAVLLVGLARVWSDRDPPAELERAIAKADELGWSWVAAELRALVDPDRALPGTTPLVARRERVPEWERRLALVEAALGGDAAGEAPTRLAWFVGLDPLQIEAREQVRQKSSWSPGKRVSWARLLGEGKRLATTDADNRIIRCLRVDRSWGPIDYEWLEPDVYEALADHPHARTLRGERLTVVRRSPRLEVRRSKGRIEVKLTPILPESGFVVDVVGDSGVEITRYDARQAELARLLGRGLSVPEAGGPRVERLVETLGEVFEVAGDEAAEEPGDPAPTVQLWPEGSRAICARAVVRPLGVGGPVVQPGVGAPLVLGTRDGRPVRARRSHGDELARLAELYLAVPALATPFPDRTVSVGGVPEVLELLVSLRERGVAVEWPKGAEIRLRGSVGGRSASVRVSEAQEWFAVRGDVEVDAELSLSLSELLRRLASASGRFVQLDDGSWLALTEQLRRQLDGIERVGLIEQGAVKVHRLASDLVEELVEDAGKKKVDAGWREHLARRAEAWVDPEIPVGLGAELRPYQVDGFRWLARLAHLGVGACLADDMGLGKTVTALALLLHRSGEGPALVVAPTSVGAVWRAEAFRFAPDLVVYPAQDGASVQALPDLGPGDLVITSYGVLVSQSDAFAARRWATVVADEAQQVKNAETQRHKALTGLSAGVRVALTGTPIENHLGDLWALFAFLNPGLLGPSAQFLRRFARPIESGDRAVQRQLHHLVAPFVLRRTKAAVLSDLPPRTDIDRVVDLGPTQAALYDAVRREALEAIEAGGTDAMQLLAHLTRLRLAACHPRLVSEAVEDDGAAKLAAFDELVDTLRDSHHRALVFSQFVRHLALVREHLDRLGVAYQYLDGETPAKEREKRVAAFQRGEGLLFLISLRAGGFGLNLTAADYVVHLDPWWNPAVEDQASDRAHRIGQTRPVTVYRLVARGTIEERILELHRTKRDLAERLLTDTDAAARLTAAEMLELLRDAPG